MGGLRAAVAVAAGACVLAGLGARLHPALDSFGIVMPYAAALLLLLAAGARMAGTARIAIAALAAAGLTPVAATALSDGPNAVPGLALLQHNLRYDNAAGDLAARLEPYQVATLQEVRDAAPAVAALPPDWTAARCEETPVGHTAVLSRLPVLASGCLDDTQSWIRVATPAGPVTFVSVHLNWPWPAGGDEQARQVARMVSELEKLPGPVVIAGDFNQMPWSATVRRLSEAVDAAPAPGLRVTLTRLGGLARLPIDHVLLPAGWSADVQTAGRYGSDHRSLTARLRPAADVGS